MCYKFECSKCGKYTWGGCGKHLKNLYASIDEGKHCMCNSWPGVEAAASSTDQQPSSQSETSAQGNEESSLSKQPKMLV